MIFIDKGMSEGKLMRVIEFEANEIEIDLDTGFVGFVSKESEHYFWMQPDELDPCKDLIWLERDDQGWGGAGGDWSVYLTESVMSIILSDAPWMECDKIVIRLTLDRQGFEQLCVILKRNMQYDLDDLIIEDEATP